MYYINDSDSEYILNKHHSLSSDYDIMNCFIRHDEIFDESTGMDGDEIIKGIREQDDKISHRPHSIRKAMALRFVLDNTRISCDNRDRYPAIKAIDRPFNQTLISKWKNEVLNEIVPEVGKKREDFENDGLLEDNAAWNNQTVDKTYTNAIEENLDGYFAAAGVVLEDAPAYTLTFKKDMAFEGTVTVAYGNGYVRNFAVNKEAGEDYKLVVGGMY